MLLENKHAVIYGAGGTVGAAVARAFAREGARVSLAGRTRPKLDRLAQEISAASGNLADVAQVDALDVQAVEQHAGRLAEDVGALDICFNAVGDEATLGQPLLDIPFAEFIRPITRLVTAQFLIAKAVARYMIQRNSGVILTMTGSGVPTAGGCRCPVRAVGARTWTSRRPRPVAAIKRRGRRRGQSRRASAEHAEPAGDAG